MCQRNQVTDVRVCLYNIKVKTFNEIPPTVQWQKPHTSRMELEDFILYY